MRKAFTLALLLTIIAFLAYVTKPSDEACITEARKEFRKDKPGAVNNVSPGQVNTRLLAETLEKSFLDQLTVEDHFLMKGIYLRNSAAKKKIGWGAFGWVNVTVK